MIPTPVKLPQPTVDAGAVLTHMLDRRFRASLLDEDEETFVQDRLEDENS